ncbi:MAG: cyclophilin-like fold protein [Bulleidia sp.]
MKKRLAVLLSAALPAVMLAGCGSTSGSEPASMNTLSAQTDEAFSQSESEESETMEENTKIAASDGAEMQTEDKTIATRIPPENGTKINILFGDDAVITGVLNDSETAEALIEKLPYTVHMNRYSHDFCGVTEDLPYNLEEVHYGWLNGDIDYAINAPYFTILFRDEDVSEQYGYQVNIGVITSPIAAIDALSGSYDVTVELAE